MSHVHLTMAECVGIKLFVFTGLSYGKLPDALAEAIQPLPGAAHYRCMSRSDLVVWVDKKLRSDWSPRTDCGLSAAGLSRGCRHAHQ